MASEQSVVTTTTEPVHGALPWSAELQWAHDVDNRLFVFARWICDAGGQEVCNDVLEPAHAALIVTAVNAHAELLAALHRAVDTIRAFHGIGLSGRAEAEMWRLYQSSPEMQAINAALAKAESTTGRQ